jgi:RNA polymerase sigma-70 factor (ECF subfamily)
MPDPDDQATVHAILSGQPRAFERLVAEHHRLVWHLVQRLVREPEVARELCQETFLRVSRSLHQFRFESRLASWIGRVATSVALRHLEKGRLQLVDWDDEALGPLAEAAPGADDPPRPDDALDRTQRLARLRSAIDALPALPRLCVTLFHLDEHSVAEVCALTGLPEGTVKSHLRRSREKLRAHLESLET